MERFSSYESAPWTVVKLLKDALGGKLLRCSTFKLHQSGASAGGNEGMLIEVRMKPMCRQSQVSVVRYAYEMDAKGN